VHRALRNTAPISHPPSWSATAIWRRCSAQAVLFGKMPVFSFDVRSSARTRARGRRPGPHALFRKSLSPVAAASGPAFSSEPESSTGFMNGRAISRTGFGSPEGAVLWAETLFRCFEARRSSTSRTSRRRDRPGSALDGNAGIVLLRQGQPKL
jgi:hypothetical protein